MDRSLANKTPNISNADSSLQERILAGHVAILRQVDYFRKNFGKNAQPLEKDGTRVTEVDENISLELFEELSKFFPNDDYCSEESAETPDQSIKFRICMGA